MKNIITLAIFGTFTFIPAKAQLVNGGFEDWMDGNPVGWNTTNFPPSAIAITQTSDAYYGNSAALGTVLENPFAPGQPFHPFMSSDQAPITQPPASLTGWYKYSSTLNSTFLLISIVVADANGEMTGIGALQVFESAPEYTSFTVPVDYTQGTGLPPASAVVSVLIAEEDPFNGGIGSTFHVDGLAFSTSTAIEDHKAENDMFVGLPFPQPIADMCGVRIRLSDAVRVTTDIVDISGRQIVVLVDRTFSPGEHMITWEPPSAVANGTYFIRMATQKGVVVRTVSVQR